MKKRILSLVLTLALCMGLSAPAFAAGTTVDLPKISGMPKTELSLINVLDTYNIQLVALGSWTDNGPVEEEKTNKVLDTIQKIVDVIKTVVRVMLNIYKLYFMNPVK